MGRTDWVAKVINLYVSLHPRGRERVSSEAPEVVGLCGEFGLVLSRKWRKSFREKLEYKNLVQGEKKKLRLEEFMELHV